MASATSPPQSKHTVFAKANLDYFAKIAQEYDEPARGGNGGDGEKDSTMADLVRKISRDNYQAILQAVEWDPTQTEMMDFACGTGMTTLLLAPHCKRVVGVDQSEAMLDRFRAKLSKVDNDEATTASLASSSQSHSLSSKVDIVHMDLLADGDEATTTTSNAKLQGRTFDIIICTMSYHHFAEPDHVTKVLTRYLKPGGKLVIVDFMGQNGDVTSASHGHAHAHNHAHAHDHAHAHAHNHAHAHAHAHSHTHDHHHSDKDKDSEDPTEAQYNSHRVAHVIAHTSFVLADFDRFFSAAGLERVGEPRFSTSMEWPGARGVKDLYVVVGQLPAGSSATVAAPMA